MKTVLITGGTRGIGLGIAKQLAKHGLAIAVNGIRPASEVEKVILELSELGATKVIYCKGNVALSEGRSEILAHFYKYFDELNFLVNNAGVAPKHRMDLLEISEESFDRVLSINLKGPFLLSQLVAKKMIKLAVTRSHHDFAIINISSVSSTMASPERGQYCISKAGLSMMSRLFAVRMGEYDIPVYEVRPGVITTDMTSGVTKKYDDMIAKGLCLQKRWGKASDVGKAVRALISGEFPYSTGQVIMVDGGLTINRL